MLIQLVVNTLLILKKIIYINVLYKAHNFYSDTTKIS